MDLSSKYYACLSKNKQYLLTFRCDEETFKMLQVLSSKLGLNRSETIRACIFYEYVRNVYGKRIEALTDADLVRMRLELKRITLTNAVLHVNK